MQNSDGVHPEMRYFAQDRGLIFEQNPREMGFAFHRASEDIVKIAISGWTLGNKL
jgi:hypothetical protein